MRDEEKNTVLVIALVIVVLVLIGIGKIHDPPTKEDYRRFNEDYCGRGE